MTKRKLSKKFRKKTIRCNLRKSNKKYLKKRSNIKSKKGGAVKQKEINRIKNLSVRNIKNELKTLDGQIKEYVRHNPRRVSNNALDCYLKSKLPRPKSSRNIYSDMMDKKRLLEVTWYDKRIKEQQKLFNECPELGDWRSLFSRPDSLFPNVKVDPPPVSHLVSDLSTIMKKNKPCF
jgi:hypothetical protein